MRRGNMRDLGAVRQQPVLSSGPGRWGLLRLSVLRMLGRRELRARQRRPRAVRTRRDRGRPRKLRRLDRVPAGSALRRQRVRSPMRRDVHDGQLLLPSAKLLAGRQWAVAARLQRLRTALQPGLGGSRGRGSRAMPSSSALRRESERERSDVLHQPVRGGKTGSGLYHFVRMHGQLRVRRPRGGKWQLRTVLRARRPHDLSHRDNVPAFLPEGSLRPQHRGRKLSVSTATGSATGPAETGTSGCWGRP
jgi:hypothetical protein